MVQAGVLAGSTGIWISHGSKSCEIRYADAKLGSLEELRSVWIDPSPVVTPAQAHLLVGLRTIAFARQRPILVLHHCERFGQRSVFWNGSHLSAIQEANSSYGGMANKAWAGSGEMVFHVSGSPLNEDDSVQRIHGVKDVVASEFKELQSNAVCCPVPLWVDSRPVNHFGMQDVSMTRRSLAFSAQSMDQDQTGPLLSLPPGVQVERNLPSGAKLAWTLYHSDKPETSRLSWVKGGVVCQEEFLHAPSDRYQVRLFVPAEDLDTDLTALHPRFPSKEEQYRRVARAVLDFCREIEANGPLAPQLVHSELRRKDSWLMAAVCVLGGVFFAPASSGASLAVGIGGALTVYLGSLPKPDSKPSPALESFRRQLLTRYSGHA